MITIREARKKLEDLKRQNDIDNKICPDCKVKFEETYREKNEELYPQNFLSTFQEMITDSKKWIRILTVKEYCKCWKCGKSFLIDEWQNRSTHYERYS